MKPCIIAGHSPPPLYGFSVQYSNHKPGVPELRITILQRHTVVDTIYGYQVVDTVYYTNTLLFAYICNAWC